MQTQSNTQQITIYTLTDPRTNLIHYVGQTKHPRDRRLVHLRPDGQSRRAQWLRAVLADGVQPVMVILEVVSTQALADERERYWIAHGRSSGWPLVNTLDGGEFSWKMPREIVERIAAKKRGTRRTDEAKALTSASLKAYYAAHPRTPMSEVVKAKISATKTGKPGHKWTAEQTTAASARLKGQPGRRKSAEEKAKISATLRAQGSARMTEAHRQHISAAKMGHSVSEETRRKIAATKRLRHEARLAALTPALSPEPELHSHPQ